MDWDDPSFVLPDLMEGLRALPKRSTREIVWDNLGAKKLGHNPSWVKVSDVEALLEKAKKK